MGVKFDRILEGFDGPFEKVNGLQGRCRARSRQRPNGVVLLSHASQQRVHRDKSLAGRGARRPMGAGRRSTHSYITGASPVGAAETRGGPRRQLRPSASRSVSQPARSSCVNRASALPISMADRCRRGGRDSCSSNSNSRSRSCIRKCSTRGICRAASTC